MKKYRLGQSMVELVLAVAVMVIIMTASAAMMSANETSAEQMSRQLQAMSAVEEGIQATISIADRSWADLAPGTHGLAIQSAPAMWVFQGGSDATGDYTRTITVSDVDSDTRKVVVTVVWHPEPGRSATIEEEIYLTDWAFI